MAIILIEGGVWDSGIVGRKSNAAGPILSWTRGPLLSVQSDF